MFLSDDTELYGTGSESYFETEGIQKLYVGLSRFPRSSCGKVLCLLIHLALPVHYSGKLLLEHGAFHFNHR